MDGAANVGNFSSSSIPLVLIISDPEGYAFGVKPVRSATPINSPTKTPFLRPFGEIVVWLMSVRPWDDRSSAEAFEETFSQLLRTISFSSKKPDCRNSSSSA